MYVLAITLSRSVLAPQVAGPQPDTLAAAKTLYAAADYEEALKTLAVHDAAADAGETDKYRALCLLALGRTEEVERVLEALVVRNPSYRLSDADVTPRLVAMFQTTRDRLLPRILDDSYAAARASFDSGNYADASVRLRALLALLAEEDAALPHAGASLRQDLRRVAQHFLELAETAQARSAKREAQAAAPVRSDSPSDETLIADVVQRYVHAYEALDADGVVRVFQGENPNPLRAAFNALKMQRVQAKNVRIAVDPAGESATVRLSWIVETIPKVGSPIRTQTAATLRMRKAATGDWLIVGRR